MYIKCTPTTRPYEYTLLCTTWGFNTIIMIKIIIMVPSYLSMYLQATSTVAGWLFALPRGDHARHSHLNDPLPKNSYTMSFVIFAVTSCKCVPVWGSTWDSSVDGGGWELPLHLNDSCNRKNKINLLIMILFVWS